MTKAIRQITDRFAELRRGVSKENRGLEVGPFFRPICPKKEGFNTVTLDVFSRNELIKNYANDPNVYPHFDCIEEVDIVSSEPLLEAIRNSDIYKHEPNPEMIFDYIITSHHFEHLANPIQFLQAAEILLKPDGFLSMAIPIHTRCFDLYKPLTITGKFIDAYVNKINAPSLGTVYDHLTFGAHKKDGTPIGGPHKSNDNIKLIWDELENFQINPQFNKIAWFKELQTNLNNGYIDAHCNFFNPYSFCLIIADLKMIGLLTKLQVHNICEHGLEFIVHLRKSDPVELYPCSRMTRTELVQATSAYSAYETYRADSSSAEIENETIKQLNAILESRSWKLTRPYRAAGELLSKLLVAMGRKKKQLISNFIT